MGFKLRSGNGALPFKQMGSSPAKVSFDEAFASRDMNTYGDMSKSEYIKEAKRQKQSFDKTGKWDVGGKSKTTAIDIANPTNKENSETISKIEMKNTQLNTDKTRNKFQNANTEDEVPEKQDFSKSMTELASEKKAAKKEKRKKFFKELGAGLEEAGATISGAYGEGGTGDLTTANQKYKQAKANLKQTNLNNQWRENRNAKLEKNLLASQDPISGSKDNPLTPNYAPTDPDGVKKESDKENANNVYGIDKEQYDLTKSQG